MFFVLAAARCPDTQVTYVTSQAIPPRVVDYYLHLIPGVSAEELRRRITFISVGDWSRRPLVDKVLERPRLLERIRTLIGDRRGVLMPFIATESEAQLALRLGIPMYGPDPALAALGTKSGGRRIFAAAGVSYPLSSEEFIALLAAGGVVEERLTGGEVRSPSVQLRSSPTGDVEVLSTHDQLLGGSGGQTFLGCVFPAEPAYRPMITADARVIGHELARRGVVGRFGIDFVTTRTDDGSWQAHAIEVNLRNGGDDPSRPHPAVHDRRRLCGGQRRVHRRRRGKALRGQ